MQLSNSLIDREMLVIVMNTQVLIPSNVINFHHEAHEGHEEKIKDCVSHMFIGTYECLQQYF